jgi:hypothetical protein
MSHNERVDKADKRFNKAVQVYNKLSNSLRPDHEQEVRVSPLFTMG